MFMEVYSVIKQLMQFEKKRKKDESESKESEDDATKNSFACRETKWSVKNNNR